MKIILFLSLIFLIKILFHFYCTKNTPVNVTDQAENLLKPFFDFAMKTYNIKDFKAQIVINKEPLSLKNLLCLEYSGDSNVVNKFISNDLAKTYVLKMLKLFIKSLIQSKQFENNTVFRLLLDETADPIGILSCSIKHCNYWPLK